MTLLAALVRASNELQKAEAAAYVAGRHDLVAEIRAAGFEWRH